MAHIIDITLICSGYGCTEEYQTNDITLEQAEECALGEGWDIDGDHYYCPNYAHER